MSPEQLLGELHENGEGVLIGDLEAGTGTLLRLGEDRVEVALVVAQPTAKALDIAARACRTAANRGVRVVVVANRVRDESDAALVRAAVAPHEVVVVPEDPGIARADREGRAPIDVAPDGPGVQALGELARRLVATVETAPVTRTDA